MAKPILTQEHFRDEEAAFAYVEARLWPAGPVCPKCGAVDRIYRLEGVKGKTGKVRHGLRKCGHCEAQFTVTVGTVMEATHFPLHLWLQAIYLMNASKKGISTRQLQRTFQCSMKTAWHLSHRIRAAMADLHIDDADPMGGAGKIVEADETFIGGLEKNKHRNKRRHAGRGTTGKEAVFALVERGGKVRSMHIPKVNAATVRAYFKAGVDENTAVMTDSAMHYDHLRRDFPRHEAVDHKRGEYVRGDAHTNTIEGYFSILKRGLTGIYHGVSPTHLHRYLSEFDHRYSHREALGIDDVQRADLALKGVKGKRLTYRRTRHGASLQQADE